MLLLIKKQTDTLIEKTTSRPQETLECTMNKQLETLSLSPPKNLAQEGKRLLAVTCFEATNSIFNFTNKNKRFSIATPRYWSPKGGEETINQLNELLDRRSQYHIELHVKEVEKRDPKRNRK